MKALSQNGGEHCGYTKIRSNFALINTLCVNETHLQRGLCPKKQNKMRNLFSREKAYYGPLILGTEILLLSDFNYTVKQLKCLVSKSPHFEQIPEKGASHFYYYDYYIYYLKAGCSHLLLLPAWLCSA